MAKNYTAQEMREVAKLYDARAKDITEVCSRTGGSAMITVFATQGISDHKVAAMLRQAADLTEREERLEKKYEYAVKWLDKNSVANNMGERRDFAESIVRAVGKSKTQLVRRPVGEWEEVSD